MTGKWGGLRRAGVFLGGLLFCIPALAAPNTHNFRDFLDNRENNGSIRNVTGCPPSTIGGTCIGQRPKDAVPASINANIGWRVGMLAGQPLVEMAMNWTPKNLEAMLPESYRRADPDLMAGKDKAANARLSLYAVDVAIGFKHKGRSYTITDSVGVPAAPGNESSFNVAGSYDWGKFIKDSRGNLVGAELAKEIVKAGIKPTGASIVQAKVNTYDLQNYWYEKNADKYNAPLREAIDSQLSLLESTFGLPVGDIRAELDAYQAGHTPHEANAKLASIFERLTPANLPEKYLGSGLARDIKLRLYGSHLSSIDNRLRSRMEDLPPLPGHDLSGHRNWLDEQQAMFRTRELRLAQLQNDVRSAQRIEYEIAEAERREERRRAEKLAEREREEARQARRSEEAHTRRQARTRARYMDVNRPYGESGGGWNSVTAGIRDLAQQVYGNGGYGGYSGASYGTSYVGSSYGTPSTNIHLTVKHDCTGSERKKIDEDDYKVCEGGYWKHVHVPLPKKAPAQPAPTPEYKSHCGPVPKGSLGGCGR